MSVPDNQLDDDEEGECAEDNKDLYADAKIQDAKEGL